VFSELAIELGMPASGWQGWPASSLAFRDRNVFSELAIELGMPASGWQGWPASPPAYRDRPAIDLKKYNNPGRQDGEH